MRRQSYKKIINFVFLIAGFSYSIIQLLILEISFLMLGGNIGDRMDYLSRCIELLRCRAGRIAAMSSVYECEPWGFNNPQWFLNQAVALETNDAPNVLLEKIQIMEKELGRVRTGEGYQARTMDIDILLYGSLAVNTPELVIPHPRMTERMFVLKPMAELAPGLEHPVLHRTMEDLMKHCADMKQVKLMGGWSKCTF